MTWLPQIFAYIEFSAESKLVDFRFSAELGSFCFGEKKNERLLKHGSRFQFI